MKVCKKCNKEKDETEFRRRNERLFYNHCKECQRQKRKEDYWANRGLELKKNKEYRERNKEVLSTKRRDRTGATKRNGKDLVKFKKTVKRRLKNYREKFPFKIKAHNEVRKALRKKALLKPDRCEMCKRSVGVEAHHEDYEKSLEVRWLCRQCHIKIHRSK